MMRVKSAAMMTLGDRKVYEGSTHAEIGERMKEDGVPIPDVLGAEKGFITECGRFIMRKAAARVAIKAGQIKEVERPGYGLMSHELPAPRQDKPKEV